MKPNMRELTLNFYRISRCTHRYFTRELRKLGVTMGQFPFIMSIAENDGISQEKLSNMLRIAKSTTADVIRQLMESGYVTRETDPADRRNFRLHVTEKACALVPRIQAVIDRCHAAITSDLSDSERAVLTSLTARVCQTTEARLERPVRPEK